MKTPSIDRIIDGNRVYLDSHDFVRFLQFAATQESNQDKRATLLELAIAVKAIV